MKVCLPLFLLGVSLIFMAAFSRMRGLDPPATGTPWILLRLAGQKTQGGCEAGVEKRGWQFI